MYAVIETGGKQYRVAEGDTLYVEKLDGDVGDTISFDRVLLIADGDDVSVGSPVVDGAAVTGEIVGHGRDKKVVVFKFKRRKDYRRRNGHRQAFTAVKISSLSGA
jgi:large subunit ribosomal protein L21